MTSALTPSKRTSISGSADLSKSKFTMSKPSGENVGLKLWHYLTWTIGIPWNCVTWCASLIAKLYWRHQR